MNFGAYEKVFGPMTRARFMETKTRCIMQWVKNTISFLFLVGFALTTSPSKDTHSPGLVGGEEFTVYTIS